MPVLAHSDASLPRLFASQVTTDAYENLGLPWSTTLLDKKTITVRETAGVNAVKYRILGSLDGMDYVEVIGESNLPPGQGETRTIADFWKTLQVQVKSSSAGLPGTVEGKADGSIA